MKWKKPRSIEELKALCLEAKDGCVEGFIQLMGGFRSSKRISYYPNEPKPWDIFESICDDFTEFTDKELADHGIFALALKRGALFIESDEPEKGGAL